MNGLMKETAHRRGCGGSSEWFGETDSETTEGNTRH